MKKIAFMAMALVISTGAFAQKRSDLQGPAYKNYKPWQHDTEPTVVYTNSSKADLKGPDFKNYKPWKNEAKTEEKVVTFGSKRSKLRGPAYKNYKPWLHKDENEQES